MSKTGLYLMKVFAALALASLEYFGRPAAPRYNPARRKTFRSDDWRRVADAAANMASTFGCILDTISSSIDVHRLPTIDGTVVCRPTYQRSPGPRAILGSTACSHGGIHAGGRAAAGGSVGGPLGGATETSGASAGAGWADPVNRADWAWKDAKLPMPRGRKPFCFILLWLCSI